MSDLPKPNCRIEQHLNAIATGDLTQLPDKDYSRVEQYLRYIALNGGTGEGLTADQKEKLNKIDVLGAQMVDLENGYATSILSLPTVHLDGTFTGMNAATAKQLKITLIDKDGTVIFKKYANVEWQGSSSTGLPKKNYGIDLLNIDGSSYKHKFGNWPKQDSFHLKANYIDNTMARNIVTVNMIRDNYKETLPVDCLGVIDGFPVIVWENGVKKGLYTWNLKQHRDVYGLSKSNPNHLMYRGEFNDARCNFTKLSVSNLAGEEGGDWEDKHPKTNTPENRAKLNRLIQWVIDCNNNPTKFKAECSKYLNVNYLLDYWICCEAYGLVDSLAKNMNLVTYDGNVWYPTFYDVDNAFGMTHTGAYTAYDRLPTSYQCPSGSNLLWKTTIVAFADEIKARKEELKDTLLNEKYIYNRFFDFMKQIPKVEFIENFKIWTGIVCKEDDFSRAISWYKDRTNFLNRSIVKEADENGMLVHFSGKNHGILNNFWIDRVNTTEYTYATLNGFTYDVTNGWTNDGYLKTNNSQYAAYDFGLKENNGVMTTTMVLNIDNFADNPTIKVPFHISSKGINIFSATIINNRIRVNGYNGDIDVCTLNDNSYGKDILLVMEFDAINSKLKCRVNGMEYEYIKPFNTVNSFKNATDFTLNIGGFSGVSTYGTKCRIKDVRVYNRRLEQDDIQEIIADSNTIIPKFYNESTHKKVTFNGTENWLKVGWASWGAETSEYVPFELKGFVDQEIETPLGVSSVYEMYNNNMISQSQSVMTSTPAPVMCYFNYTPAPILTVSIKKSHLETIDAAGFKKYLTENPMDIWFKRNSNVELDENGKAILTNSRNANMFVVGQSDVSDVSKEVIDGKCDVTVNSESILNDITITSFNKNILDITDFKKGDLNRNDGTVNLGSTSEDKCTDFIEIADSILTLSLSGSYTWKKINFYNENKNFLTSVNDNGVGSALLTNSYRITNAKYIKVGILFAEANKPTWVQLEYGISKTANVTRDKVTVTGNSAEKTFTTEIDAFNGGSIKIDCNASLTSSIHKIGIKENSLIDEKENSLIDEKENSLIDEKENS